MSSYPSLNAKRIFKRCSNVPITFWKENFNIDYPKCLVNGQCKSCNADLVFCLKFEISDGRQIRQSFCNTNHYNCQIRCGMSLPSNLNGEASDIYNPEVADSTIGPGSISP